MTLGQTQQFISIRKEDTLVNYPFNKIPFEKRYFKILPENLHLIDYYQVILQVSCQGGYLC